MHRFFLIISGLFLTGNVQAQLGIRAGANYGTFSTETNRDTRFTKPSGKVGTQLGVFYEQPLNGRFSLVPELQYCSQTTNTEVANYEISDGSYYGAYQLHLIHLSLPVLVRATFGHFYLAAGPQVGLLVSAFQRGSIAESTIAGKREVYVEEAAKHYPRFQTDITAGGGIKRPGGFGVDFRAYMGLITIFSQQETLFRYGSNLKSQVVQASFSYQFKSKG